MSDGEATVMTAVMRADRVRLLPRFHCDGFYRSHLGHHWFPAGLAAQATLGATAISALRGRGHDVHVESARHLGRVCAAGRGRATGMLHAAADP
jgi:gamma-glutamyltranspeptidase/glutathione hydrolase